MHPLERDILKKIVQDKLVASDERIIIVAVSGGPDSVALLHLLVPLQHELSVTFIVVYVNHGLRQLEAEIEERTVCAMCGSLGITYESVCINVRKYARQKKLSLEHAARDLRYQALRSVKNKYNASLIAVAHTADDQAEEILIRLLRGSGRKGLSGMQTRSGDIIRPLLSTEKKNLLHYLQKKMIPYCVDSSNSDMRFLRNRIRHRLIPYLEKNFDRGVRSALCKTADTLADDEHLLDDLAENAKKRVIMSTIETKGIEKGSPALLLKRKKFVELPSAIQRRVVEKILWMLDCEAKYSYILQVVRAAQFGTTGSEIHLKRGLRVGVQKEFLEILYPEGQTPWRGKLYTG